MAWGIVRSAVHSIGRLIARLILSVFVFLTVYTWLDVLVFQPEEYERLIGGEAGCGKFKSYSPGAPSCWTVCPILSSRSWPSLP
jgi:hypothetical protein